MLKKAGKPEREMLMGKALFSVHRKKRVINRVINSFSTGKI